ncbi:MAG: SDR family NAD(P)-dependent oxidoreductase [Pseudonocardiales bacterium]
MGRSELVIGVSPFGEPNARLVGSVCRGGGLGVLDLGAGQGQASQARTALELVRRWAPGSFGVRVAAGCALAPDDLPAEVDTVLLGAGSPWQAADLPKRYRLLVEITGVEEALRAAQDGAAGLVARGHEAGGRVGELGSFALLQRLLAEPGLDLPVWICGGVGLRTAAAAVLGGAAGVVLDSQLALLAESELPDEVGSVIAAMDGSETVVLDGHRVLLRRGPAQLLPIGQDAWLAKRFAERFGTAGRAVRAVRESILDTVRDEGATDVLCAGAALSRALGTVLPIAQGPMTRVSDQAGFAAVVAEHGAMPFVALALANRDQTRALLDQTRTALGERPWGVGVLGFAPEQTRAAQLEAIREARPSCVVIAGGRPSQAAALEEVGISAFLHVPSPGLLEQFLEAGARKFIFEGSECGGHVGPRSSFALWEAQLTVLSDYLDARIDETQGDEGLPAQIQVLFAGGIHDARSAAMVAAMAAPLARRGAGVGVLMGTAYLFTEEAVGCGAIEPLFQRQVVAAERTELLETAPGHVTRCLASPFAESFQLIRSDLHARGLPDRQVWEELELLNQGRLRIASKGVQRHGADLVSVGEDQQLAQGLYMAGQVAVLRKATTTIAALHSAVSDQAANWLTQQAEQLRIRLGTTTTEEPTKTDRPPLDVAIVGMAAMFPDAPDLASFWANVVAGVNTVTEVPAERWDTKIYYSPGATGPTAGALTPSKWGAFLPRIPFDPLRYGIPPASLTSIEPVQLLALEAARRALADAGYEHRDFDRSRTAVVFGAEAGGDLSNAMVLRTALPGYVSEIPEELTAQLPPMTEDSFPGMLANVIAGRIANRLDLGGANYTVDAACASSLAAIHVACQELASGTSELVLCGGGDLHNCINDYLVFSSVHALSPTGQSRTFDASADGIALGEGVACVALKRLADAERDGDRVYAVIKGVGSASDGKSRSLTAPRPEGQRNAVQRAYRNARISPAEVGLVEAHGTGTVLGDRTELRTLTGVFTEAGAAPGSCALGSVKSQIGHTKCAAGLAGLIKAALALHTGIRPPTLHVTQPNKEWQAESSPFAFSPFARPWAAPPAERVAGVSAFGFGGTNFHVVLQGYDGTTTPRHGIDQWPTELLTFRGADHPAACHAIARLVELTRVNDDAGRPWRLRDLARTASRWADRSDEPVQVAIVASDLDDLADLLRRAAAGEHDVTRGLLQAGPMLAGPSESGKVAVLFPGQGSQRPGMLAELFVAFPELGHLLQLGRRWADALFPPAAFDPDGPRRHELRLRDTRVAQPALGLAGLAMHHLLTRLGVEVGMLAGHSYGELVALCAAGAFDPAALLELSEARAEAILAAAGDDPGTMAAVSASGAQVERVLQAADLADQVVLANHNSPRQVAISGPTALVERAITELAGAGHASTRLPVACAFHSPVVADAGGRLAEVLSGHALRDLATPVWSNRTAATYPPQADAVRDELAAQVGAPVRFAEQIESMYAAGARVFVEAGPGQVLTGLVAAILGERPHVAVACDAPATPGLPGFLAAVAKLAVAGVRLRTGWLFNGRDAADVTNTTPPPQPGWNIDGHLVRTADGACLPGGLTPARQVSMAPAPAQDNSDGDALISEFLRTSREMVAAQRDVLLTYLGAEADARPAAPRSAPPPTSRRALPVAEPTAAVVTPVQAPTPKDNLTGVLEIISQRTGYPIDMIEPGLDLEADLSIDSIKRTEIMGVLATRLGERADTTKLTDPEMEELAKARTAGAIAAWLDTRVGGAPRVGGESRPNSSGPNSSGPNSNGPNSNGVVPTRFVIEPRLLSDGGPVDGAALRGRRFVVVGGDSGLGDELAAQLSGHGAAARDGDLDEHLDGLVWLDALTANDDPLLPEAFLTFQAALAQRPRWLLAACPIEGGVQAAGLRGFFRTVAKEYPDTRATLVEVDPTWSPEVIAQLLLGELTAPEGAPVVRHAAGARHTLGMVDAPLADDPAQASASTTAIGLDRSSVVLLVGGARGITARFAARLARESGCRIELAGRTPLPTEPADPAIAAADDRPALRAALATLGHRSPAEVERAAGQILAQREVEATLAELPALGSSARYHTVDARDPDAMHRLVKDVYAEHDRIDGVIYAAGVLEDRLLAGKDIESFRRVFATKVDGAAALLGALEDLPDVPRFVVLFGSVAAVLGNPGQADYAAANDALESLGASWSSRTGHRALTVHWGPWAPGGTHAGMVTSELAQEYDRRGIALIDPEEGTRCLLGELAWGAPSLRAVVYTAPGWPV